MNPLLALTLVFASVAAVPLPASDDQTAVSTQKRWIDDFANVFQGFGAQTTKAPETATTGPQVFDLKFGYDMLQSLLAKMFAPKPIVDTIEEKDKYGNDGSKFEGFGSALVKRSEAISGFLNSVFSVPKMAAQMVSNSITNALNGLGAKLVGL